MTKIAFSLFALVLAGLSQAAPLSTEFTYQGQLQHSAVPAQGPYDFRLSLYDAPSGGNAIGSALLRNDVAVTAGIFSLALDFGMQVVADRQHYLAIEVRPGASTGSYTLLTPRQKLTAAPGALYALATGVSEQALSLAAKNVLMVATEGAPYTSVAAALADVVSPGSNNRYLIVVGPGIYNETGPLTVPGYVHVRGSGSNVTVIRTSNSQGAVGTLAASVVMLNNAELSAVSVQNTGAGAGSIAIGVYVQEGAGRDTLVHNVRISASGVGGTGRFGVYLNDAEPRIRNAWIRGSGAAGFGTAVNAAIGSVNVSGGFPQALIEDSVLLGAEDSELLGGCSDNTGTGYAWMSTNSAPEIRRSHLCGGHRGVYGGTAGQIKIRDSVVAVSSTTSAFLFESTGSATVIVVGSQVQYAGNKFTGTGGLVCRDNINAGFADASDGSTPGTACN